MPSTLEDEKRRKRRKKQKRWRDKLKSDPERVYEERRWEEMREIVRKLCPPIIQNERSQFAFKDALCY